MVDAERRRGPGVQDGRWGEFVSGPGSTFGARVRVGDDLGTVAAAVSEVWFAVREPH